MGSRAEFKMISVLQTWQEVGAATLALQREGLQTHLSVQKNWDHFLLYQAVISKDRQSKILDLGCGEGYALKLLHSLGFINVHGLDFRISWRLRLSRILRMWRQKTLKRPYYLHRGDIIKTLFHDESYDIVLCISTIEHGVDMESFLQEVTRILKPGGFLFLTTDYWEEKIHTDESARAFGLPWKVFCRSEIVSIVRSAEELGLFLSHNSAIPPCSEKTVFWQNTDYTFISMLFTKTITQSQVS